MKREEIKAIFADATDEQLKAVMDLNGADVEKFKSKVTVLETELKEKKEDIEKLNTEFEELKTANASGEDWKAKFEALQAENEAKAKQAEADRIVAEKTKAINKRFDAVVGEKKFIHDSVREFYLKKFGEAIDLEENKSRADADIFFELTKDDRCFEGVTAVKIPGGNPRGAGGKNYTSKDEIMAIKDSNERLSAIQANPNLFRKE